jgi:membrane protein YqaA with SNARE-associated domain
MRNPVLPRTGYFYNSPSATHTYPTVHTGYSRSQAFHMYYFFVFFSALLVDLVPFIGPPAWIVMVFFQIRYGLDIWMVLCAGVAGSSIGRYVLSQYVPFLAKRYMNIQKKKDIEFIGERLENEPWRTRLFVLGYTLLPLPSTPLFTAAGMTRISLFNVIPPFLLGKFISDMVMVVSGDYAARNALSIADGMLSWQSISGLLIGLIIIVFFFCIDWRELIQNKKFKLNIQIWK